MKKATFKKSDDTYPHGSLREQEWVVKTSSYQGDGSSWFHSEKEAMEKYYEWYKYEGQLQAHTEKPKFVEKKPIPCSANNWKDGQELTYGIDYTLKWAIDTKEFKDNPDPKMLVAVPIVQETEDELWKEMGEDIQRLGIISVADFFTKQKSKFTIQRREPKKWVTSREIGKDGEFHRAKDNQFPIE